MSPQPKLGVGHPEFEMLATIDNGGVLHTNGTSGHMERLDIADGSVDGTHTNDSTTWPHFDDPD